MDNDTYSQQTTKLLTINEASSSLRISRWTIYRLIREGELHTLTIGNRRFVDQNDINDFIKGRKESEP